MKAFKNIQVDLGNITAGTEGHKVFWEFEELDKNTIATFVDNSGNEQYAVQRMCGCTADVEVRENGISAVYNDNGNSTGKLIKRVKVYYKSGELPTKVKNERGVLMFNPKLPSTVLSFIVEVEPIQ